MSDDTSTSPKYTERDIELGGRANKIAKLLGIWVLILCLAIAVFAFIVLPLDTRLAYSGSLGRSGLPMPLVVAIMPLAVFFTVRPLLNPKPDIDYMDKGGRMIIYCIGVPMLLFFLFGQCFLVQSMLNDAGVFSG